MLLKASNLSAKSDKTHALTTLQGNLRHFCPKLRLSRHDELGARLIRLSVQVTTGCRNRSMAESRLDKMNWRAVLKAMGRVRMP